MLKDDIVVIIPTLNEEGGIGPTIDAIPKIIQGKKVSVLVIDGCSRDKTVEIAKSKGAYILFQKSKGKGMAILEALEYIQSEIIVMIDGDNTYSADEMDKLVIPLLENRADMVVGTRLRKRERGAITLLNLIGNWVIGILLNFYNIKREDILSGYRAISKAKLDELSLFGKGFEIETELTLEALRNDWRIVEIPLFYRCRKGKTKLNPIIDGFHIFRKIVIMIRDLNPLAFFGLFGVILFLISLCPIALLLFETAIRKQPVNNFLVLISAVLIILSFQFVSLGVLADMNLRNTKYLSKLIKRK